MTQPPALPSIPPDRLAQIDEFSDWAIASMAHLSVLAEVLSGGLDLNVDEHLEYFGLTPAADAQQRAEHLQTVRLTQEILLRRRYRDSVDLNRLLDSVDKARVLQVIEGFLAGRTGSLLEALGGASLDTTLAPLSAQFPMLALARLVAGPAAKAFAQTLLSALGWYGAHPEETGSPLVLAKLTIRALSLHLDPREDLLGFDVYAPHCIGETYGAITARFSRHLLDNARLANPGALPLALHLLQEHMPADFQVIDIPPDLAYRTSSRWVAFKHGVDLAQLIEPGAAQRLTFDELLDYPQNKTGAAGSEEELLVATALVLPVVAWASAVGHLPADALRRQCTAAQIQTAMDALTKLDAKLIAANESLRQPMPTRFGIARQTLAKLNISEQAPFVHPRVQDPVSALELAAQGTLGRDPHWVPGMVKGPDAELFKAWPGPYQSCPDIPQLFEQAHAAWISQVKGAYTFIVKTLIEQLPMCDQLAIRQGHVRLYSLGQLPHGRWERYSYTDLSEAKVARYGFVIHASHGGQEHFYEVLPHVWHIAKKDGVPTVHIDGEILESYDPRYRSDIIHYPQVNAGKIPDHAMKYRRATLYPFDYAAFASGGKPVASGSEFIFDEINDFPALAAEPEEKRIAHLAYWVSHTFLYQSDANLYKIAKGQTRFEAPDPLLEFLKQYVIPFWSAIEDLSSEKSRKRPALQVLAALSIAFDALSILIPGLKAARGVTRAIGLGARSGVRAALPRLGRAASGFAVSLLREFNPLALPYALLQLTQIPRLFGAIHRLRLRLKVPRPDIHDLVHMNETQAQAWRASPQASDTLGSLQVRRVGGEGYALVLKVPGHNRVQAPRFLLEPHTRQAYGPALRRRNDAGELTRQVPAEIQLQRVDRGWSFIDETPDLTKRWIYQGDDVYLESGGYFYQKIQHSPDQAVLRRTHSLQSNRQVPRLSAAPCRPKRNLQPLSCEPGNYVNAGYTGQPADVTQGRETVDWFTDYKITRESATQRFFHGEHRWDAKGRGYPRPAVGERWSFLPRKYRQTLTAEVLGGNDIFKQIRIAGGIYGTIKDTRVISAVVASRRQGAGQVMITRVDNNAFYRGEFSSDLRTVTLHKIDVDMAHLEGRVLSEDDYLALIYQGSYDANAYIKSLPKEAMASDYEAIQKALDQREDILLGPFIGGPFDMGTTPAEAALFCKYARRHVVIEARKAVSHWRPLSQDTALATRSRIADELNTLFQTRDFTADSILDQKKLKTLTLAPRNLAYARLTFKPALGLPDTVYYSLSGTRIRSEQAIPLSRLNPQNKEPLAVGLRERGWTCGQGVVTSPTGVRYINSQPKNRTPRKTAGSASAPASTDSTLFLPDLSDAMATPAGNSRMLESERNILEKIRSDAVDFNTVESMEVFSVLPTCQSCTVSLSALSQKLPPGKFVLHEGPQSALAD
ncbi:hypothetical protein [Pseudomonas sp. nanlin1]|uniref:hypothetical protein n=1 Tax=Pseudomonas sp. nanlin1 TaxID=3040605 RepID=UPI00388E8F27